MSVQSRSALAALSQSLADLVALYQDLLVTVAGRGARGSTGLPWGEDLVFTADHAVEREEDLTVSTPDGRALPATLVGRDPSTDLALLRVPGANLRRPPLASAPPRPGHLVLAMGRPRATVGASLGLVRAVGGPWRSGAGGNLSSFIDVNGALPRGYSGGPLVDAEGGLLGLNTAGLVRGGTTVPTATLERVAQSLLNHGRIQRAWLGLGAVPATLPRRLAATAGQREALLVVSVESDGPADKAGLSLGDVILSVGGERVAKLGDLLAQLGEDRVGQEVQVSVLRAGVVQELRITLGSRPAC